MFFKVQINPVWNEIEFLLEVNTYLRFLQVWDHPRLRGAYVNYHSCMFRTPGSPPLTRGILPRRATAAEARQDHPRLRGAYVFPDSQFTIVLGSPPLTRGIRVPVPCVVVSCGITPAYAGHTRGDPTPQSRLWDHPRLRGAYAGYATR